MQAFPGTAQAPAVRARPTIAGFADRHFAGFFVTPVLALMAALLVFPALYTGYLSLHTWSLTGSEPPRFVGLANFLELVARSERFRNAWWTTLYYASGTVLGSTVVGVGLALLMNQRIRGRSVVRGALLLPIVATPAAMALTWALMFNPTLGVLNYFLEGLGLPGSLWVSDPRTVIPSFILIGVWSGAPLVALITLGGLQTVPVDALEAARIDGANAWRLLWHVTLPLLRPIIMVAVIFRTIDALRVFDLIYIVTEGGPGFASMTLNLEAVYNGLFYHHMGLSAAYVVMLFGLVLVVSCVLAWLRRAA